MCRSRRSYRIISVVVLSFYLWTFGGLSSIAHAAKDAVNQAQTRKKTQEAEQSPESGRTSDRKNESPPEKDTSSKKASAVGPQQSSSQES